MAASVSDASGTAAPNGAPGSQTLARGLAALQLVATSPTGLTVQQVADDIGVHRTIAYRLLSTLAQFRMVAKGEDGRYRSAAALAVLGASFDNNVRQLSVPTLRALADEQLPWENVHVFQRLNTHVGGSSLAEAGKIS